MELLVTLGWWFACVLATEASAELTSQSKFFAPLRNFIGKLAYPKDAPPPKTAFRKLAAWCSSLINCGYCTSVWTSFLFSCWLPMYGSRTSQWMLLPHHGIMSERLMLVAIWLVGWLALHRLSNLLHMSLELLRRGRVQTHDLTVKLVSELPPELAGLLAGGPESRAMVIPEEVEVTGG